MKILLAADENKNLINGAAAVVTTLGAAFRKMGHDVKVLLLSPDRTAFKEGDDYFLPSYQVPLYPELRMSHVFRHEYIDEIAEWRPDIIHIHTEGSMARISRKISKRTGAPYIMTMHTYYEKFVFPRLAGTKFPNLIFRVVSKIAFRGSEAITVPSEKGRALLIGYGSKKEICVIPNGIKLDRFRKECSKEEIAELLRSCGVPDPSKVFVCIARLSAEKKHDELLANFAEVIKKDDEARLLMVGDGPEREALEKMSAEPPLSGHVFFTGLIPQEELYRYYKAGIAFLSASDFEMHSLTYLESLACGVPLVCRDDPCLKGVLDDGYDGFAWNTKDEFVSACFRLMEDRELAGKMSEAALSRADRFDEKTCAGRMTELYERMIRDHAKCR